MMAGHENINEGIGRPNHFGSYQEKRAYGNQITTERIIDAESILISASGARLI